MWQQGFKAGEMK